AAWQDHQWAVLRRHIVEHDADGQQIVVGVRIEGPVLVPLDGGAIAGRLHVELAAMQAQVRADELLDGLDHARVPDQAPEERMAVDWVLEAPHARSLTGMRLLEVVDFVAAVDEPRLGDKVVDDLVGLLQRLAAEGALDEDVAVPAITLDLLTG